MNHEWLFLPMRASNDLLGDPAALRARLDEDSYLYFSQVLDCEKIMNLRRAILGVLQQAQEELLHAQAAREVQVAAAQRQLLRRLHRERRVGHDLGRKRLGARHQLPIRDDF